MAAPPPVRIPLQLGLSGLWNGARASILTGLSVAMIISGFGLGLAACATFGLSPRMSVGVGIAIILAFILVGRWCLGRASAARRVASWGVPSDLYLDAHGLRVEGGPRHGTSATWSDLQSATCQVVEALEGDDVRLVVRGALGEIVLAQSDARVEAESFRALAETIQAFGEEVAPETPHPPAGAPLLLTCPRCAAPLSPADVPEVTCHSCGATTAMHDDLRERLRAPEDLARGRAAGEQIRSLQSPRSSGAAAGWLGAAQVLIRAAWPVVVGLFILLWYLQTREPAPHYPAVRLIDGEGSAPGRAALAAAALAVVLYAVALAVGGALLANRRALRQVFLRFRAGPPSAPHAPWTCRQCAAPLPASDDRVVVACVYCRADNVLGIDLRRTAQRGRDQPGALAEAFAHRRRARVRLIVTLLSVAGGAFLVTREVRFTAMTATRAVRMDTFCDACRRIEILNRSRRQLLTVEDGGRTRTQAIPSGARASVECKGECVLSIGEASMPIPATGQIVVEDGLMIQASR